MHCNDYSNYKDIDMEWDFNNGSIVRSKSFSLFDGREFLTEIVPNFHEINKSNRPDFYWAKIVFPNNKFGDCSSFFVSNENDRREWTEFWLAKEMAKIITGRLLSGVAVSVGRPHIIPE